MSAPTHRRRRAAWRPVAAATIGGAVLVGAGFGVWATLNATAGSAAETVSSGTLKLSLANNGAGFSQAISNMAPTDVVNRYVTLTNTGSLDAQALTMKVAATGASALIADGVAPATTKALKVAVTSCSVAWNPTAGTCGGTSTQLLAPTTLSALATPASLISGSLAAGSFHYLQIAVALPDQNETTVNGVLPTSTIQGLSADLTYTFEEQQRTGTTTNS